MKWDTPLARLRSVGIIESSSFVLLLFVAMPLKYLANEPRAVTVVGSIHGALWIAYLLVLAIAWRTYRWSFGRVFLGGVASVLPLGPYFFDRSLQQEDPA